jgi:chemotaxis protein histidine kinase CheA
MTRGQFITGWWEPMNEALCVTIKRCAATVEFHTNKDVAGFPEPRQIQAPAHAAETLLDLARKGKMTLVGPRLEVVLEARDVMTLMIRAVETAAKNRQAPSRQEGLEGVLQRLQRATRDDDLPPAVEKKPAPASPAQRTTNQAATAASCHQRNRRRRSKLQFPHPRPVRLVATEL